MAVHFADGGGGAGDNFAKLVPLRLIRRYQGVAASSLGCFGCFPSDGGGQTMRPNEADRAASLPSCGRIFRNRVLFRLDSTQIASDVLLSKVPRPLFDWFLTSQ